MNCKRNAVCIAKKIRYLELLWYGLESRSENKRNEKQEQREWQMNALPVLSTLQRTNHTESQTHVTNEPQIDYYLLAIHEDRDTALLSLLKSFIQCAPQMVLQIYLLAKSKPDFNLSKEYVQMAAIISSLFEMSWSMASYNRALRRSTPNKLNVSRMATITHFLWRFCTIGSRVLAIALFTSEYSYWVCPVAIGHWGVMTIWIMHQQTRFCDSERGDQRPCHEYVFNMIVGAIYLFCFLNVKDEPTRYKYLSFYTIVFSENISFIILWYVRSDPLNWYHTPALATVLGAFGVGMLLMLIYYWFLHPNGRPLWVNRAARCC
ncbi:unnamed protein product [Medioppia subpectinata]|uniref:XK-related protein n=1 Tax=Medioppia subpectinata TaxID=1979941 RepID=A0A7R9KJ07_9ACAR|nr:unnamed protein product [Medioppia subpectinata]CAG2103222.1 unnamed protein product [Medioppia subpectinata]